MVDDVSLAALLQEKGLDAGLAPDANLLTILPGETLAGWSDWLTRQWLRRWRLPFPMSDSAKMWRWR